MDEQLQQQGSMKHKCNETLNRVVLALDRELSAAEEQQLLSDLQKCSHCNDKYNIEKEFKDYLSHKMEKKPCAESIKAEIKTRIHNLAAGNA